MCLSLMTWIISACAYKTLLACACACKWKITIFKITEAVDYESDAANAHKDLGGFVKF